MPPLIIPAGLVFRGRKRGKLETASAEEGEMLLAAQKRQRQEWLSCMSVVFSGHSSRQPRDCLDWVSSIYGVYSLIHGHELGSRALMSPVIKKAAALPGLSLWYAVHPDTCLYWGVEEGFTEPFCDLAAFLLCCEVIFLTPTVTQPVGFIMLGHRQHTIESVRVKVRYSCLWKEFGTARPWGLVQTGKRWPHKDWGS